MKIFKKPKKLVGQNRYGKIDKIDMGSNVPFGVLVKYAPW